MVIRDNLKLCDDLVASDATNAHLLIECQCKMHEIQALHYLDLGFINKGK